MPKLVSTKLQVLFNEFKDKILDENWHPANALDNLKSRLTALWLLSENLFTKEAQNFIKRTSVFGKEEFEKLLVLASEIKAWLDFNILVFYKNTENNFIIEYSLRILTIQKECLLYFHALFQLAPGDCCVFVSQHPPLLRLLGDPVLDKPGLPFPEMPTDAEMISLQSQIDIAKSVLIQTGGAGIAANQCLAIESPWQFAIAGVFKHNAHHAQGVARRYPGVMFPEAMIMVNPKVISFSETRQKFKHACLSVPGPNRCELQSPQEITIEYLNPLENLVRIQKTLKGIDAVALWHELNHIVAGKTYIEIAIASLSLSDLSIFKKLLIKELQQREQKYAIPDLSGPFYITILIDQEGRSRLQETEMTEALQKFTKETLMGLLNKCHSLKVIEKISCNPLNTIGHFSRENIPETPQGQLLDLRARL